MQVTPIETLNEDTPSVEYDSGLVSETTAWIEVPSQVRNLSYVVDIPSSANCRIEISTSKMDDIRNDNDVVVSPWTLGDITVSTQDSSVRVNAFRLFVTSGNARLCVNGK